MDEEEMLMIARARAKAKTQPPHPLFGDNPVLNTASDFMTGVGQGGTLAFGDELSAGVGAAIKAPFTSKSIGEEYNDQLGAQRQIIKDAETRSPAATLLGEVAGGMMTLPVRLGTAPVTAPATAAQAMKLGRRAWELFKRSGKAGAETAAYGAAYGAGKGEGVQDRAEGAGWGAAIGGPLGFASIPATEAAFKVGQKYVAPAWRSVTRPETQAARNTGQMIGREQELARMTGQKVPDRGLTDAEFDLYKSHGLPVMNVDRTGPISLKATDAATVRSGEAAAQLVPKLNDRSAGQLKMYEDAFDSMLPQGGAEAAREAIIKQSRKINDANYKMAYLHPNAEGLWNEGFEQLAQSDIMQGAMRKALSAGTNKAALGGSNVVRAPMSWVKQADGTQRLMWKPEMGDIKPNLAYWDQVKRKLDDVIDGGTDSITKKMSSDAQDAVALKQQLVSYLDQMVPAYKTARSAAGRYLGEENASRLGEKLFKEAKKYNEAKLNKLMSKWTPAEREEAAIGYLDAARTHLRARAKDEVSGKHSDLSKHLFGSGSAAEYEVARALLGKQRADRLEVLNRFNALANRSRSKITGGSPTAARQKADLLLSPWATAGYGAGVDLASGDDWNPMHGGAVGLLGGLAGKGHNAMRERMAVQIGKLMASADRTTLPAILGRIADDPKMMTWLRLAQHPLKVTGGQASTWGEDDEEN